MPVANDALQKEEGVTYREALTRGLDALMSGDGSVFLIGEDIEDPMGGSYKVTLGLSTKFGRSRVRNTPISEAAIVGAGVGAAMVGTRPIVEVMFFDFVALAMDQLVNQAAFASFMSGGQLQCPLVVRCQGGAGRSSGAQHSKSLEAWLCHVPGLSVVAPSSAQDAYWSLLAAYDLRRPVVVFESNLLYRRKGALSLEPPPASFFGAATLRPGTQGTVVSWGRMVEVCMAAAHKVDEEDGASWEVIDLRWLSPIDRASVLGAVQRTGRLVVVHEAWTQGGLGAEIVSSVVEELGPQLKARPVRVGADNSPHPFAPNLESEMLPSVDRVAVAMRAATGGGA